MLKRMVNELRCTVTITTTGPVLVKSGQASVSGPDMTPVKTYRNGNWEVYLPGSSLKGVIRSHLEKVCRTLRPGIVCNPFVFAKRSAQENDNQLDCPDFVDVACSDKFELREKTKLKLESSNRNWGRPENTKETVTSELAYADACPICRLFGSTSFIGRLSIGDAYLINSGRTETRDGVGIDRFTGGAANTAKFDLETVSTGVSFKTDILMRNFECWQIGMLLVALDDLRDQLIRIGSGRSRGFGAVKGEISELSIHTLAPAQGRPTNEIWGLGKFFSEAERISYRGFADDILTLQNDLTEEIRGLRRTFSFVGDSLTSLETAAREHFVSRLDHWEYPARMNWPNDWQRGQNNG